MVKRAFGYRSKRLASRKLNICDLSLTWSLYCNRAVGRDLSATRLVSDEECDRSVADFVDGLASNSQDVQSSARVGTCITPTAELTQGKKSKYLCMYE